MTLKDKQQKMLDQFPDSMFLELLMNQLQQLLLMVWIRKEKENKIF